VTCKQCGTELPEHAKFCLQCGAAVPPEAENEREPEPEHEPEHEPETPETFPPPRQRQAPLRELEFFQPAITGGMFLGLLSSIPVISAGNCICCMWVLLGGAIATVLLTKQRPIGSITYGDGAFAGVLSGTFGAVVGTILQMSFHAMTARFFDTQQQQIEDLLNKMGAEPPWRDWVLRVFSGEISTVTVLFTFVSNLIAFSLFAMIGGILAVAILQKRETRNMTPRPPSA